MNSINNPRARAPAASGVSEEKILAILQALEKETGQSVGPTHAQLGALGRQATGTFVHEEIYEAAADWQRAAEFC